MADDDRCCSNCKHRFPGWAAGSKVCAQCICASNIKGPYSEHEPADAVPQATGSTAEGAE